MTPSSANPTAAALEAIIAGQVRELQQLPSANRLSEASQTTLYAMARSMLQAGQWQQASAYLSFLLLYAPTHPDYLCTQAECAMRIGAPTQASQLLALALYVEPESSAIALALAEALIEADAPAVARVLLLQLLRLAKLPADLTEHTRAGLLLQTLDSHALT